MRRSFLPFLVSLACQSSGSGRPGDDGSRTKLDFGDELTQVGFDQPFHIDVRALSGEARRGEIHWKQVGGAPLRSIVTTDNGFRFSARTPPLDELVPEPLPWGIVPLSPRTRAEAVLEAEWIPQGGGASRRYRIVVAAAARSNGLPNVPVDHRLQLGGRGWHVQNAPAGATESVDELGGVCTFAPRTAGTWTLVDGDGKSLHIQAGRYDDTPLDCGREGCHRALVAAAETTPMTWALARRFEQRGGAHDDVGCAMACHATGEPGTHDGGFLDVASELRISPSLEGISAFSELPRPLRRLGAVGCLGCHGPGALPEEEARWSILRADVCAYCHDAPPRYGHVAGWRASTMARADRDPTARSDVACAGCHTTWGFLQKQEVSPASERPVARQPPAGVGTMGIACAACHAAHGAAHAKDQKALGLLREVRLPTVLGAVAEPTQSRSGACLICHAPDDPAPLARASASLVWAGKGGVDPGTGTPLVGPAPHVAVAGGCVGCHDAGPEGLERGAGHAFRSNPSRCNPCHGKETFETTEVRAQALELWKRLLDLGILERAQGRTEGPVHATDTLRADRRSPLARAAYDLSLLVEDKAADVHNRGYARMLLETAKKVIDRVHPARTFHPGSVP
jgi:hypothetical protein